MVPISNDVLLADRDGRCVTRGSERLRLRILDVDENLYAYPVKLGIRSAVEHVEGSQHTSVDVGQKRGDHLS